MLKCVERTLENQLFTHTRPSSPLAYFRRLPAMVKVDAGARWREKHPAAVAAPRPSCFSRAIRTILLHTTHTAVFLRRVLFICCAERASEIGCRKNRLLFSLCGELQPLHIMEPLFVCVSCGSWKRPLMPGNNNII